MGSLILLEFGSISKWRNGKISNLQDMITRPLETVYVLRKDIEGPEINKKIF